MTVQPAGAELARHAGDFSSSSSSIEIRTHEKPILSSSPNFQRYYLIVSNSHTVHGVTKMGDPPLPLVIKTNQTIRTPTDRFLVALLKTVSLPGVKRRNSTNFGTSGLALEARHGP